MKKKCLFFFLLRSSIKQLLQYYTERIDRKITHSFSLPILTSSRRLIG